MNEMDILNVDMNKLIELIRKDTNNYKNLKTSLCGRAFDLENRTLVADKIDIEKLTRLIEKENNDFDKTLNELNKGFSLFSGKSKQIKKITKTHEDKLMILNSRLNRKRQEYEENRILLQEIIDKLNLRGIIWHHARKIIAKKLKEKNESESKVQKPKLEDKPIPLDIIEDRKKNRINPDSENPGDDTNKIFKEKNFFNVEESYRILGLTPEEFREYQIILQFILRNRERLKDDVISIKLRMAMAMDGHRGKFKNLALYASDFSLYNDIFKYLMINDGRDYANNFTRYMTAKINNDRFEISRMDRFFQIEALNIMQRSGFDNEFIQRNFPAFEKELKYLYTSPSDMRRLLERIDNPNQSYEQLHTALQGLIREEVYFRIRNKDMHREIELKSNIPSDKGYDEVVNESLFEILFSNNLQEYNIKRENYYDGNYKEKSLYEIYESTLYDESDFYEQEKDEFKVGFVEQEKKEKKSERKTLENFDDQDIDGDDAQLEEEQNYLYDD